MNNIDCSEPTSCSSVDAPAGKLEICYRTGGTRSDGYTGKYVREIVLASKFDARMEALDEAGCSEFRVRDADASAKLGRVAV